MADEQKAASWAVGQCTMDQADWVSVNLSARDLLLSPRAAKQFATALLIAADNVSEANAGEDAASSGEVGNG